jgi:hypothetical protein
MTSYRRAQEGGNNCLAVLAHGRAKSATAGARVAADEAVHRLDMAAA